MDQKTDDFLADIYRGAKMGVESINTVLPKINDESMKNELMREQINFQHFETKALEKISKDKNSIKDIPAMQKMGTWVGIQLNTMIDSTSSHIADLMIQGNNMGVIGITKAKNSHVNADQSVFDLADELIKIQENNIESLKPFLK